MEKENLLDVINSRHINWQIRQAVWRCLRDCNIGESAIKFSNELYLPMPAGFTKVNSASISSQTYNRFAEKLDNQHNPNYHDNPAYEAYKTRATFPEIVNFTLRGLLGLALKQTPLIKLPDSFEYLMKEAEYPDLLHLYYQILEEVLLTGKANILIDIDSDGNLRPVIYKAEDLVNWRRIPQTTRYDEVVLQDSTATFSIMEELEEEITEYLYLTLENGIYTVYRISGESGEIIEAIQPQYKGKTLDYIPFITVGSSDLISDLNRIPLAGISKIAVQIYQLDADLRQAEYLTCNPTLVITGADEDSAPSVVGSSVVLTLPDTSSKAYYTTTDTSALSHIASRIEELFETALKQGSTILGGSKDVAESGEALRIRQESNNATLISIIENVGRGIKESLDIISDWSAVSDEIVFEPSKEFTSYTMTPAEQQALVQSWQAGAITHNTLLENFAKAGILPDGVTPIEEYEAIQQEQKMQVKDENQKVSELNLNLATEPKLPSKSKGNLAIERKDIYEESSDVDSSQVE